MPTAFQATIKANPGLLYTLSFVLMTVVNLVVLAIANALFPNNVVLGTMSLTTTWALILSSTALAALTVFVLPLVNQLEIIRKKEFAPPEMIALYFVINFVLLWLLTRASDVFGLGISSWLVGAVLAFVLDMAQGMVMMQVETRRKK